MVTKQIAKQEQRHAESIEEAIVFMAGNEIDAKFDSAMFATSQNINALASFRHERNATLVPSDSEWATAVLLATEERTAFASLTTCEAIPSKRAEWIAKTLSMPRPSVMCKIRRWDLCSSGIPIKRKHEFWDWVPERQEWSPYEPTAIRYTSSTVRKYSARSSRFFDYNVTTIEAEELAEPTVCGLIADAPNHVWQIVLRADKSCPGVSLMTSADGVLGMFAARDKTAGKNRRDALRHWVRAHNRKIASSPASEVAVKKHLRGATEFSWFGLHGTVIPRKDVTL